MIITYNVLNTQVPHFSFGSGSSSHPEQHLRISNTILLHCKFYFSYIQTLLTERKRREAHYLYIYKRILLIPQQLIEISRDATSTSRSLCIFPNKRVFAIINVALHTPCNKGKIGFGFIVQVYKYLDVAIDGQPHLIAFIDIHNTNDISVLDAQFE